MLTNTRKILFSETLIRETMCKKVIHRQERQERGSGSTIMQIFTQFKIGKKTRFMICIEHFLILDGLVYRVKLSALY